jgi:uncharacterized membrane protein
VTTRIPFTARIFAAAPEAGAGTFGGYEMAQFGPLEFLVIAFPGMELSDRVANALRTVEVSGDVRIVDALLVVKDATGKVRSEELTDVAALADVAAEYGLADAPSSLVDAEDVQEVGEVLHAGSHAIALLVEHVWARETAEAAWSAGGALMAAVRIPDAYVAEATTEYTMTA